MQVAVWNGTGRITIDQFVDLASVPNASQVNAILAADQPTTSSAMADLTGLGFAIGANEKWTAEWTIYASGSLAGMKFQLTGPASPANVLILASGNSTGVTLNSFDAPAVGVPGQAYIVGLFSGKVTISACFENGATPGTVQLQFASATILQPNTAKRGSFMNARKAA